jgi:hypothetical protein
VHDSCCYCDEKGEVVKTSARGHVMTFPFWNTCTGHATLRKMKNIVSDCFTALETNSIVSIYFVKILSVEIYRKFQCSLCKLGNFFVQIELISMSLTEIYTYQLYKLRTYESYAAACSIIKCMSGSWLTD